MITAENNTGHSAKKFEIYSIKEMKNKEDMRRLTAKFNDSYKVIWVKKELFCIPPDQSVQPNFATPKEGFLFVFNEPFLYFGEHAFDPSPSRVLLNVLEKIDHIHIKEETHAELHDLAGKILKEFQGNRPFRMELLKTYFQLFLTTIAQECPDITPMGACNRNIELVQSFMRRLEKSYKTTKSVSKYAEELCVSPGYLNFIVKKTTGHPAKYHILQRIILEAKHQAVFTDDCLKQIAWELGFSNICHFSKLFKNATGINFTSYKKRHFRQSAIFHLLNADQRYTVAEA